MTQSDRIHGTVIEEEQSVDPGTAGECGCGCGCERERQSGRGSDRESTAGPCACTATGTEDEAGAWEDGPCGEGGEQVTTLADELSLESDEDRLSKELEQTRSEVELYRDRWMRSTAEFENYKRRMSREFGEVIRGANEELLKQLLPIIDNFDRALNHAAGQSDEDEGVGEAFRKGVELISSQFRSTLEKNGLQNIPALGEQFDPHLHEALMQRPSDEHRSGTIVEVVEQGYRLNERVLRHSKVIVSQ